MERLEKLSRNILNNSVNLKKNENILIELMGEKGIELGISLMKEAALIGAKPFFNIVNYDMLKVMLENADEEYMSLYGRLDRDKMKNMDAYVVIKAPTNLDTLKGIDGKCMEIYNKCYTLPVHLEERVKNTKWCIINYPTEALALKSNMTLEEYTNLYYKVCTLDYTKLSKAMDNLVNLMQKTDKVRIVGKGTDISFSIKDIKVQKYFGTFNLPDGEVATAPVKDSINGYITYNTESTYNGEKFKDIYFEFEKGKITKAIGSNTKALNEILDTDDGSRYIGEFALGLNPYIENVIGDVLFDEKVYGSFHLTPGTSVDDFDNTNRSAIHWDLVCIQTKEYGGGEIYFDDVLIRKNGEFVLKELECLNKENLVN